MSHFKWSASRHDLEAVESVLDPSVGCQPFKAGYMVHIIKNPDVEQDGQGPVYALTNGHTYYPIDYCPFCGDKLPRVEVMSDAENR